VIFCVLVCSLFLAFRVKTNPSGECERKTEKADEIEKTKKKSTKNKTKSAKTVGPREPTHLSLALTLNVLDGARHFESQFSIILLCVVCQFPFVLFSTYAKEAKNLKRISREFLAPRKKKQPAKEGEKSRGKWNVNAVGEGTWKNKK